MAMGVWMVFWAVVGLVFFSLLSYVISVFNSLVQLKNNIKKSFANIDVLLKQRSDELPKLINSVKGYMKYESKLLTALTKARTDFLKADTMAKKAKADNAISGALKSIFAVAENYPKLEANQSFLQLQERISGIENELADRREFYNDSVNTYNIKIESFPDRVVANMLGYQSEEMFKATELERKDVKVEF